MEMERINENTIRVLIDSADLQARGIRILDLLGNHQQIQDFFYSILQEVDANHQFQDDDSVTFQVMPNNNGLELFISKNDPLNTDSQPTDAITDYLKQRFADQANDHASSASASDQNQNDNDDDSYQFNAEPLTKTAVAQFNQFDDLIDFAKMMDDHNLVTELYKYEGHYYLTLRFLVTDEQTSDDIKNQLALVYEYGNRTNRSAAFLGEHGKKLMDVSALHLINHYFN